MRWEDERYVRLYTRDTITWKMLPWEGKALLALLFRKVDRAGLIDVGDYGAEGVAALVDLPTEVVTEGLASLIKAKTVQWAEGGTVLLLPNFLTECDSLARVQEFLGSDMTLLVLSGGVGTRKSGSACYGLVMRAGRYVTADDLSGLAASRDEDGVVSYRQIKKAGLLVIDDLGGEYVDDKGWFVRALNAVIDARYSACLKTILTTNLTAEQFKATYGERIADRIRESGRWRDIGGQSVRRVDSSR
jgi:hypothetical protein